MSIFTEQKNRWLDENDLAFCIDQVGYEVSPGHCLVCPKREVRTVLDMSDDEWLACLDLIRSAVGRNPADGYNIGVNCGEYAGQSIMHAHIHVIPRYAGDDTNPRGGVRAVIPGKKSYGG